MTEAGAKLRRRLLWKYLRIGGLLSLLLLACLGWFVTTEAFQTMVRTRLITELENITGGRVELDSIHTAPLRLRVEVRGLTIHGKEARGEVPYAHVDRVTAQVKIISVLGAEFGFHSLVLDHPVLHVIVYPDGTTNQPAPRIKQVSGKTPIEQLFRLSISRLEIRRGQVLWNNQQWPVDFETNDVSAELDYSLLRQRYESSLLLGKIVTQYRDYRPLAWMAEAHFSLSSRSLTISSFRASSGRSRILAHGRLVDFRHPEIEAAYDATLDLAEASAIARRSEMRHGTIEAQGNGTWSPEHFSAEGKLLARDFDWHDQSLNLSSAALNAQYSVNPERLLLSQMQGRLLGGSVAGDAEVVGWLGSPAGKSPRAKGEEQKGSVRLRLKDLSAGAIASALSTSAWPLQRMNLAGSADGSVEFRWKGSTRDAETEVGLEVTAPPLPAPHQMPVNGHAHGTYHSATEELEITEFNVASRASEMHATGQLASHGALKLSANTSNLGEWQTVLAGLGAPVRIPAILQGKASFNGTATGKIFDMTLAGKMQAEDFYYVLAATERAPVRTIHWDSLTGDVQLSQRGVAVRNGALSHGDASIGFAVSSGLVRWRVTDQTPFNASIEMHHADAAEALSLAGYNYPLRGTVNLSLQASGTALQSRGGGRVQISDGNLYGEAVQSASAMLRFDGSMVKLGNMQIAYGNATVAGTGDYDFSTRRFHFDLSGDQFDLARLPAVRDAQPRVAGGMSFAAQGSGTLEEPAINATVHLSGLALDQHSYGDFTLQAVTKGPELHLSGRSQFQQSELALDGDVQLRGDWPSNIEFNFNRLGVDPFLRMYLHERLTGSSAVAGEIRLQGPLRKPRELALAANLTGIDLDVEKLKLHNEGPVRLELANQTLSMEPFRVVGEDTDFSGSGTLQFSGERRLNLRGQGKVDLGLIQSFDSDFTSSGTVAVNMTVSGTLQQPVTQGRLEISHGGIAYIDLPSALSDINGSLLFNQNRFQVENLTAHTGGGLVTFGGYATWYNGQLNFDVNLQEREVRLRYPPGVSSTADADLHFVGSSAASTLSGDITVTRLAVTPGFDFAAYLVRSSRAPALPQTNPVLNRIRLDVHVVTTPELEMQTAIVRLSGEADLRVRGTAAKPVLLGRADVLEGQVYFNGTKYELERGEVAFTNPVTTTPVLDLQATTHVRDYDITLTLSGEPSKLKVSYRSEPPLPEADIITLVALGRTTQETAQLQQPGQSSFTQDASSAIINQALNATVSNRAQHLFGVSRIKVDPQGLSTETNLGRGPLVTIEQQVTDNFTLTYSTSVEQASQQIIQVEYNLSHNVSIVGLRDQNGVISFDVKFRRRRK